MKKNITLADVASRANLTAKGARAKFRRHKKDRPFDHTKVKSLSPAQAKAAVTFLKADHRHA